MTGPKTITMSRSSMSDGTAAGTQAAAGGTGGDHPAACADRRRMPEEWADLPAGEAARRVKVGIETDRGPWVAALVAAGYEVFAINPMSVARYRERHSTSGAKSDAA